MEERVGMPVSELPVGPHAAVYERHAQWPFLHGKTAYLDALPLDQHKYDEIIGRIGLDQLLIKDTVSEKLAHRLHTFLGEVVAAVVLPALLDELAATAPGVDVRIRQLLPVEGEILLERAWRGVFAELKAHAIDVAILPFAPMPVRFRSHALYEEDFVIAMRGGHPFAASPTLDRFCAADHILVSMTGEAWGFVDRALAADGRSRRIALTVPNFLFALSCVAESNLLAALPRRLVTAHAKRFGLVQCEPPLPLERYAINAVVLQAGLADPGMAWFFDRLTSIKSEG